MILYYTTSYYTIPYYTVLYFFFFTDSGLHQHAVLDAQSLKSVVTDTASQGSTAQAEAEIHEWGCESEVTRAQAPSILDGHSWSEANGKINHVG